MRPSGNGIFVKSLAVMPNRSQPFPDSFVFQYAEGFQKIGGYGFAFCINPAYCKGECVKSGGAFMDSQKADNQLNLALDASEEERRKSLELDVGYDPIDREWDLIIKYSGNLNEVRLIAESVTEMANEYAVIVIRESQIPELVRIPEVEYIEKPKRLFFQVANGKRVSCVNPVRQAPFP